LLPKMKANATNRIATTARAAIVLPVNPRIRNPTAEIAADINAYGNCVITWSIWLDPAPVDERIVVSEIGEQWSPKTAPAKTAANAGSRMLISEAAAISPAIGSRIPNDPHDVPVEKAMIPATRNRRNGKNDTFMLELSTRPARYLPVSNLPIKSTITQAKNRI